MGARDGGGSRLPGGEVDTLRQREVHHRPSDGVKWPEGDEYDRGLHRGALVALEALLLLGRDREHLDKGVGLPHDCEADNAKRRSELEEALNHTREVVRATDGITLGGDRLNRE